MTDYMTIEEVNDHIQILEYTAANVPGGLTDREREMLREFEYHDAVAVRFEKIFLVPFDWMMVTRSEVAIAFVQGCSAKDFALDIGLAQKLRPSIPD
jgi:hypothetical protein